MRRSLKTLLLPLFVGLFLLAPALASAQIYTYETPDGEILITTQEHPNYRLVEVIEMGSSSSTSRAAGSNSGSTRRTPTPRPGVVPTMGTSTLPFSQREAQFDDIIREAAEAYDVPFGFIKAVIRVESAFQSDAISHAGAMGLMQLMPRTAESLNVTDAFDSRQNIFGGAKFLRILIDRYDGDINLILAAYNAGDVAVRRHDGIPYAQTRDYVASVYYWYQAYSAEEED